MAMDMMTLDKAWSFLSKEATNSDKDGTNGSVSSSQEEDNLLLTNEKIRRSFDLLHVNDFMTIFGDWYLEKYRIYLIHDAIPTFWSNFKAGTAVEQSSGCVLRMVNAVEQLHDENRRWINNPVINTYFEMCPSADIRKQQLQSQLKAILFVDVPISFHDHLASTYSFCFKISRVFNNRRRTITFIDEYQAQRQSNQWPNQQMSEDDDDEVDADELIDITSNVAPGFEDNCLVCAKTITTDYNIMMTEEEDESMSNLNEPSSSASGVANGVCNCVEILEVFEKMNLQLKFMGILNNFSEDAVTSVIDATLDTYIRIKTKNSLDSHILCRVMKWIKKVVIKWLILIFGVDHYTDAKISETMDRLKYLTYEIFAKIRIEQLFDIIIDFPDSIPAIEDIKSCLEYCYNYRTLVLSSLKASFENRLLHPGVATNDILITYIQTIRSLRALDPSGVLLQLVADPIKNYLKSKDDTVKCIIAALTDESSDLISELVKSGQSSLDGGVPSGVENKEFNDSDDEMIIKSNWKEWKPDPIEALPSMGPSSKSGASFSLAPKFIRTKDIVSILVNVYESKDLFVEEYQRLLSKRFLSSFDLNVDFERRNLELLTLKFGESDLNTCEVMMNDMIASKKIDNRINVDHEIDKFKLDAGFRLNCLILSAQFWPEKFNLGNTYDEGANIILPSQVTDAIDKYTKSFEVFKTARTLDWKRNIGVVDVDLNFDDGTILNFKVTPILATIIYHFQSSPSWSVYDLSQKMAVASSIIRKKIIFWINKNVIKQVNQEMFELIEDQKSASDFKLSGVRSANPNNDDADAHMDEDDMSMVSDVTGDESSMSRNEDIGSVDSADDKFRVIWSYTESMLINLSEMTLERIHSTLSMFALSNPATGQLTLQELSTFLEGKIREGRLTFGHGLYRLPPP